MYVDNIGLNGLMMLEGQNERNFFITASPIAAEQSRHFYLRAKQEGTQTTQAVILTVRR